MKRIIASLLAVAMFAAIAMVFVSAADFVPSAEDRKATANNETATVNGQSLLSFGGSIVVTASSDKGTLTASAQAELDAARKELENGVPAVTGDYKVGALFDIDYSGNALPDNFSITVDINIDFGDAKVSAIYKNLKTGKWEDAKCKYKDGVATLTLTHFCPVAFLVEEGSVIITDPSQTSPQTGDDLSPVVVAVGAIILSGAAVAVVFSRKRQSI